MLAYGLIPASYLFAFAAVARRIRTDGPDTRSWFLLAAALMGMGCLHQSLHRMDPGHLLQVIPPAIICGSLIASWLIRGENHLGLTGSAKGWGRLAGVVYATLLVLIGFKLSRWGQSDLEPFSPWPVARYNSLAHALENSGHDATAAVLSSVIEQTEPWESILAFPLDSQFYALARRRISGRLHAYYPGVFDSPQAGAANLAAIQRDMPKLVLVPSDFDTEPDAIVDPLVGESRRRHAYLERFIRHHYRRVVLSGGGIMVLAR